MVHARLRRGVRARLGSGPQDHAIGTTYEDLSAQVGAAQQDAGDAVDEAKAETAATCARSFLSAFSGVFDAPSLQEGVDAAVADLQELQPQCAAAIEARLVRPARALRFMPSV